MTFARPTLLLVFLGWVLYGCNTPLRQPASNPNEPLIDLESRQSIEKKIRAHIDLAVENQLLPWVEIEINDFADQTVFKYIKGNRSPNQLTPVLSSSKWQSAMVMSKLIEDGLLSPKSTVEEFFPHQKYADSRIRKVSIEQLLSFTSGLPNQGLCFNDRRVTLQECALTIIHRMKLESPPGEKFIYSSPATVLAAAIAEKASKRSWNSLYRSSLAAPLGYAEDTRFFTKPRKRKGEVNPRPGAGLVIRISDYMKFLEMVKNYGEFRGSRVLKKSSIQLVERNYYRPETYPNSRFGFLVWLRCQTETCSEPLVQSSGLLGSLGWVHRKRKHYGFLMTAQEESGQKKTSQLMNQIRPLIKQMVALHYQAK